MQPASQFGATPLSTASLGEQVRRRGMGIAAAAAPAALFNLLHTIVVHISHSAEERVLSVQ